MQDHRMKSRKLWTLLGGTALNVFNGLAGGVIPEPILTHVNQLAIFYLGAQGFADGVSRISLNRKFD